METERQRVLEEVSRNDAAEALILRARGIPQRVGMAAAARILADKIGRSALARIDGQRADGVLDRRLEQIADIPAADALAGILQEEVTFVVQEIRKIGEQWLNDSLRLQGTAEALEGRIARFAGGDESAEADNQTAGDA